MILHQQFCIHCINTFKMVSLAHKCCCLTLLKELAGKNAEMTEEVARVRLDLNARIERLESERRSKEDLYNRISTLEKELSGQSVCTK